jgi:hypothetical protein
MLAYLTLMVDFLLVIFIDKCIHIKRKRENCVKNNQDVHEEITVQGIPVIDSDFIGPNNGIIKR